MSERCPDLPHVGPARLVGAVLAHDAESVRCRVCIPGDSPFRASDGSVPALLALERGAQAAASHEVCAQNGAREAGVGYVVSARSLNLFVDRIDAGGEIEVEARRVAAAPPLRTYAIRVWAKGALVAEGELGTWFEAS